MSLHQYGACQKISATVLYKLRAPRPEAWSEPITPPQSGSKAGWGKHHRHFQPHALRIPWGRIKSMWGVRWGWKCSPLKDGWERDSLQLFFFWAGPGLQQPNPQQGWWAQSPGTTVVHNIVEKAVGPGSCSLLYQNNVSKLLLLLMVLPLSPQEKVKNSDLYSISSKLIILQLFFTFFIFFLSAYLTASLCLLQFTMNFWTCVSKLYMLMDVFHFLGMFSILFSLILNAELTSATLIFARLKIKKMFRVADLIFLQPLEFSNPHFV